MWDGQFGAVPDWYLALKGREVLGVSLLEWFELPIAMQQWAFAKLQAEGLARKAIQEYHQEQGKPAGRMVPGQEM